MKRSRITLTFVIAAALLLLAAQPRSLAGSATWDLNPTSSDWNTAGNWTPATVPIVLALRVANRYLTSHS